MFQINVVEKIKTHVLRSVTFSENRDVCELMRKKHGGARENADDMAPARSIQSPPSALMMGTEIVLENSVHFNTLTRLFARKTS
jgi:hypothetical protein